MTPDEKDIDDAPPPSEEPLHAELARMTEDDWLLLKNELQEYLHRALHAEDPAYDSADIVSWIDENGEFFDRFYQEIRRTKPTLLLSFRKKVSDENEQNDAEFIREWTVFRDAQKARG